MDRLPVASFVASLHEQFRNLRDGEPASYIPPLAEADPSWFGISLVTTDGHSYDVGETQRPFTIQSISKALAFGMALDDRGADVVVKHVGVEPTGDPFNSITVEEDSKRPFNPMVNAGAIVTTSLLSGTTPAEQHHRMLSGLSRFAGRDLTVDERVFAAERATGDRNRAIAYFMRALDMGPADVEAALDLYFQQCSVLVDCHDLGVMAATLANRGVNPLTGERALSASEVVRVLSVMSTCGMYDFAGEWMFRVGIPAKSGVAGGIIAVVPGQLGVGVFSPPLDARGNSVRGIAVCEQLSKRFNLHVNQTHVSGASVVRRHYRGAAVRSKRHRAPGPAAALREAATGIAVFELQGDLYFATAEALSRAVASELDSIDYLVFGCRRIGQMDAGALEVIADLVELTKASGVDLMLAEASASALNHPGIPGAIADLPMFRNVDSALEWCEDRVLATLTLPAEPQRTSLADQELLAGLDPMILSALDEVADTRFIASGTVIFAEGDDADSLYFVISGRVSVHLAVGDQPLRLVTLGAGAAFGEMATLDGGTRSTTVTADDDTVCRVLALEALAKVGRAFPELDSILNGNLARNLSRRLRDTNEALRSMD